MDSAHITGKGQMVVPARLRRKYGLKRGTKVCFVERGNEILFQPVTPEFIRGMCGMLKGNGSLTQDLLDERAKEREREDAPSARHGRR